MKYMGSKFRIAKHILPIILKNRKQDQVYIEPFVGGMNSIQFVDNPRIAADNNPFLIEMWRKLINGWIPTKIRKEHYYYCKENLSILPEHLVGWIGFNCSYSGKWFAGFAGETTTKIGTIRDYQQEAINNCLKQVPKLQNMELYTCDYRNLKLPFNSIIYCDIPYEGTTKYKTPFNHKEFWQWVMEKHEEGHKVFISEYNAPKDFTMVWEKEVKSSLSANGNYGGSKKSVERLFTLL